MTVTVNARDDAFRYARVRSVVDGVEVTLWRRPRWSGCVDRRLERRVFDAPFHVVLDNVHDLLEGE